MVYLHDVSSEKIGEKHFTCKPCGVYLNGQFSFYSPAVPIAWALCCCRPSFTGRMNIYTLQHHRVPNVCAGRREGVFRQLAYVGTGAPHKGLIWPPAMQRSWVAHLPSCPVWLHAGQDTPHPLTAHTSQATTARIWKKSITTKEVWRIENHTVKQKHPLQTVKNWSEKCYARYHSLKNYAGHTDSPQTATGVRGWIDTP